MAQYDKRDGQMSPRNDDVFDVVMLADTAGNIINSASAAANINIASGMLDGYSFVHKFGAVPQMSQNTYGSVWDVSDTLYPWDALSTPAVLTIPAVDADDGGHIVTVMGLDENFAPIEETFTLSSASTVTGTKVFARVYRAYFTNDITNTGDIDVQCNGVTVLRILADKAQTLMSIYTVPAGYTAFLTKGVTTCAASADATIDMFIRFNGQSSFRIGHTAEVAGVGGQYEYDFTVPIPIPEMSDIDVRATVRSNNARVTAAFDIVLVENSKL